MIILITGLFSCASTWKYTEYAPTISADGDTLIFQSDRNKQNNYKIYIKKKNNKTWGEPQILRTVNSDFVDGAPFITYDQNSLLFSSNRKGGHGDIDIWISYRKGGTWSVPENIGRPVNSSGYEGFASLSPDGKTLYFIRDCPEKTKCRGDKFGIYTAVKVNGKWKIPKKMPAPVNSEFCEFGPIILADGKTLIFSSTRPGGFGGYDLYLTKKTQKNTWTKPLNLGDFINTKMDDNLVTIPASGEIMYYAKTDRESPDVSRIHSVPIPPELQHAKVITVAGTVSDSNDQEIKLPAKITLTDMNDDTMPIIINSNEKDGKYIALLNSGSLYDVSVTTPGYTFYSTRIDLSGQTNLSRIKKDIKLESLKIGAKIILNNMYFKYKSYRLLKSSKYELKRIIRLLRGNPDMIIEIGGHTDNVGSRRYNRKLSRKRAWSVMKHLIRNGVPKKRLKARGYGEARPVVTNRNRRLKKKNRRVEIKILRI